MNRTTTNCALTTPDDHLEDDSHCFTPARAKVRGAVQFCDRMGIQYFKRDIFRTFNVGSREGWRFLSDRNSSCRIQNDPEVEDHRGPQPLIGPEKIWEMERILETEGIEARSYTWEQLGFEVGLECSGRTVQIAMGTMNYHKCIACRRGWVNKKTAKNCMDWATVMLERYPCPEDWHRVRFTDKVHFGYGTQDKLRIIRKPGMRYCQNCIEEVQEPTEKDKKRYHCWAAVGHNFKSDIYFYEVQGNTNGKMSQQVYIDKILEPVVKPWLQAHHDFVLEEDGDSGHGPGKSNIVRSWKEQNNLETYFNCHNSPDLAPIENCWQPVKQTLRKYLHWDDATTKELIYEGWTHVTQKFINKKVASMPERLQAVKDGEGKMTGY